MTTINIQTLRNANNWSDNKALEEALKDTSASLEIYFPAGGGKLSDGAYDIWTDTLAPGGAPANGNLTRGDVTLYGDGYNTVLRQRDSGQLVFMAHPPQNNPNLIRSNITIRDMLLDGCLQRNPSYNELAHIVQLAGVDNFTFQRVLFRDFMGDGLFLGSPVTDQLRKISNLVVDRCRFESTSTTNKGRNGISFHECEKYTITNCSFENIGSNRPNVGPGPGAIDIEPVNPAAVITGGLIQSCSFVNVNRSAVALLNGTAPKATCNDVDVSYCNVQGAGFGLFDIQQHDNVRIHDNYSENMSLQGGYMGWIRDSTNISIQSNTFINGTHIRITNIDHWSMNGNGFRNCAKVDGTLIIQNGNATWGSVLYNNLYACGQPGSGIPCIYFVQVNNVQVKFLNVKWNTVDAQSNISFVGLVVGTYNPAPLSNPNYDYVDPTGNSSNLQIGTLEKKPV